MKKQTRPMGSKISGSGTYNHGKNPGSSDGGNFKKKVQELWKKIPDRKFGGKEREGKKLGEPFGLSEALPIKKKKKKNTSYASWLDNKRVTEKKKELDNSRQNKETRTESIGKKQRASGLQKLRDNKQLGGGWPVRGGRCTEQIWGGKRWATTGRERYGTTEPRP